MTEQDRSALNGTPEPQATVEEYTVEHNQVLTWPEAVRRRPGMYLGDMHGSTGLIQLLHSTMRFMCAAIPAGTCARVVLSVGRDGSATLTAHGDSGEDLLERESSDHALVLDVFLASLFAGGSRPGHTTLARRDSLAVANALSASFEVVVEDGASRWETLWARGERLTPLARTGTTDRSAVSLRYQPDPTIFEEVKLDHEALADYVDELACAQGPAEFVLVQAESGATQTFCYADPSVWIRERSVEEAPFQPEPWRFVAERDGFRTELSAMFNRRGGGELRWFIGGMPKVRTRFWCGVECTLGHALGRLYRELADRRGTPLALTAQDVWAGMVGTVSMNGSPVYDVALRELCDDLVRELRARLIDHPDILHAHLDRLDLLVRAREANAWFEGCPRSRRHDEG